MFPTIADDQLEGLFQAADADRDGLISQGTFIAFLVLLPHLHKTPRPADFVRLAEENPGYLRIMESATRNHHRIAREATHDLPRS